MPLQDANPTPSFGGFGLRSGSVAELADQLRTLPLELEGVDRVAAAAGSLCSYGVLASVPGSTRCGPRIVDSWWRTTGLQLAVQLPQNVGRGVQVPFVGAGGKTKSGEAPEYHGSSQGRPGSYPRPRGRGPIQEVRATGRRSGDGPQPPRLARGSGLPWPIMKPPIEKFAVRYTLAHQTTQNQEPCPYGRSLPRNRPLFVPVGVGSCRHSTRTWALRHCTTLREYAVTRDGLPLLVHLDNQRGYCNVLSCARRAAGRDIDYRRDAPFSGEPDSRATLQADRDRPALRKALQDLVASEPNRLVRRVTKNPLGAAVPEQDSLTQGRG